MDRLMMINELLATKTNPAYLEIGYGEGHVFDGANSSDKTCCDPSPWSQCAERFHANTNCVLLSSDDFFAQNKKTFDVVFIDGHHEYDYVRRDFFNAMNSLKDGGYVMLHDCNPPNEWRCRPISQFINGEAWNGDGGYRLIMELYQTSTEYEWMTSLEDEGCCVVKKSSRSIVPLQGSDWNTFNNNRTYILNLMPMNLMITSVKNGW
jgi:hypothetical protein